MPALTLPHVRDGLRVRLMAVLCTFRLPSSGRQGHRQCMRNALARFDHFHTRNCLPPKK